MNTHVRIFKMLALRTMAGNELKDDINNATSLFKRSSMTFCTCVGLYDRNHHGTDYLDCSNFVPEFYQTKPFRSLYSDVFCSIIVFAVKFVAKCQLIYWQTENN